MRVFGLDGARGKWAVCEITNKQLHLCLKDFDEFTGLLRSIDTEFRVVVDAPIGLIEPKDLRVSGDRDCDKAGRQLKLVGGVFPPPRSQQFERYKKTESIDHVCRTGEAGLSVQTRNILNCILAAERLFLEFPGKVIEGHPETVWPLIGATQLGRKKSEVGFRARAKLLSIALKVSFCDVLHEQCADKKGRLLKTGRDDWADAAAMSLVALRWSQFGGDLLVLYKSPDRNRRVPVTRLGEVEHWQHNGRVMALPVSVQHALPGNITRAP